MRSMPCPGEKITSEDKEYSDFMLKSGKFSIDKKIYK